MADSTKKIAIAGGLALLLLLLLGNGGDKPDEPKPGPKPDPNPKPGGGGKNPGKPGILIPPTDPNPPPWKPGIIVKPSDPDNPPPVTPTLGELTSDYPGPEQFYPVKLNDTFGGTNSDHSIAYRYLLTAGYLAARQAGQSELVSQEFARRVARNASNRSKAIAIIQCAGWNDALFGTYGWKEGKATPTSTGRAIRLLPQHSDVRDSLANLETPIRNIAIGNPTDKGNGNAVGVDPAERKGFEFLWLPALDLTKMWETGGTSVVVAGEWPDGTSKALPPPWVQHLNVSVPANVNVTTFGCGAGTWELEG